MHQHNEIGNGDIDWDETFTALRDVSFDGIAAVAFGWEEDADAIDRRTVHRVTANSPARPAAQTMEAGDRTETAAFYLTEILLVRRTSRLPSE